MIKYTIVMPMYNAEKLLYRNLEFFRKNQRDDIEYLIINDGSNDQSYQIVGQSKIKNITLLNQENHGVGYTRNVGIQKAKGKYICFLDCDDFYEENIFSFFDSIYEENYDLVRFGYKLINDKKVIERCSIQYQVFEKFSYDKENFKQLYTSSLLNTVWNQLIKKEILLKNNILFQPQYKYAEDLEFNLRLFHCVDHVLFSDKIIYNYYENGASTTRCLSLSNVEKCIHDALDIYVLELKMCEVDCPQFLKKCYFHVTYELTLAIKRLFFVKKLNLRSVMKKIMDLKKNENIIYLKKYVNVFPATNFYKMIILNKCNYFALFCFKCYYKFKRLVAKLIKY